MFDNDTSVISFARKRGLNRGKPRLWIEGKHLTDAGFSKGDRFRLVFTSDRIATIEKHRDGNRTVSGKGDDHPIIDIVGEALRFLGTVDRVEVSYRPGQGILCLAEAL